VPYSMFFFCPGQVVIVYLFICYEGSLSLRRDCLYNIVYHIYIDGNLSYDKYMKIIR